MKNQVQKELSFLLKIVRNALILAGLYFVSVWAVSDLSWAVCKPVVIFILMYIFTELAKTYKLDYPQRNKLKEYKTLLF